MHDEAVACRNGVNYRAVYEPPLCAEISLEELSAAAKRVPSRRPLTTLVDSEVRDGCECRQTLFGFVERNDDTGHDLRRHVTLHVDANGPVTVKPDGLRVEAQGLNRVKRVLRALVDVNLDVRTVRPDIIYQTLDKTQGHPVVLIAMQY